MTRIYLASRYSRREELCGYRDELVAIGHDVQARWLAGEHQWGGAAAEVARQYEIDGITPPEAALFARDDWEDVTGADLVIHFTEAPRSMSSNRGGNHVEFGIALGQGKRVIAVGFRQNVFHLLPQVEFHATWPEAIAAIGPADTNACACECADCAVEGQHAPCEP